MITPARMQNAESRTIGPDRGIGTLRVAKQKGLLVHELSRERRQIHKQSDKTTKTKKILWIVSLALA